MSNATGNSKSTMPEIFDKSIITTAGINIAKNDLMIVTFCAPSVDAVIFTGNDINNARNANVNNVGKLPNSIVILYFPFYT